MSLRESLRIPPTPKVNTNGAIRSQPSAGKLTGRRIITRCCDTIEQKPFTWLWHNRIPDCGFTIIAGDPGDGKTFLILDIATRISNGVPFIDCRDVANPWGEVLIANSEDDPERVLVPRLAAMDADLSRIHLIPGLGPKDGGDDIVDQSLCIDQHMHKLRETLEGFPNARALILDPLNYYFGRESDTYNDRDVKLTLGPLNGLAADFGIGVIGVMHLRKSAASRGMHRTIGSVGYSATARASWLIGRDPGDPDRRIFAATKNNNAPEVAESLAFRIVDGTVQWEAGTVALTAEDLGVADNSRNTKRDDAAGWLKERLALGPVASDQLKAEGKSLGLSWATLRRAKDEAGVIARKEGSAWLWKLQ